MDADIAERHGTGGSHSADLGALSVGTRHRHEVRQNLRFRFARHNLGLGAVRAVLREQRVVGVRRYGLAEVGKVVARVRSDEQGNALKIASYASIACFHASMNT